LLHDNTDAVSTTTDRPSQASDDADLPELIDMSQGEWDEINNKMAAMEQIIGSLNSLFQSHSSRHRVDHHPTPLQPPPSQSEEVPERKYSARSEGVYGANPSRTGAVHLGSRSALVDILDKARGSKDMAQALPQEDLLADLALGNESAAYPFVDLWSSDPYTFNIAGVCSVIPEDDQCERYVLMICCCYEMMLCCRTRVLAQALRICRIIWLTFFSFSPLTQILGLL
jgi:hypothetical protein